ncbi:MAG: hypothetical protein ACOC47_07980 [Alkalispirochaetaceae bacterium]
MRRTNNNSNGTSSWKRIIGLLLLAGFLVLAGCSESGEDGDSSIPNSPTEEDFGAPAETATAAQNTDPNDATRQVSVGMFSYYLFGTFVDSWDGETGEWTYTDDEMEETYTVTVQQTDNTWTWTWDDGTVEFVYTITKESDRRTFTWTENGNVFIEGTLSFGGRSGSITIYEESDNYESKEYEIAWEAASDPYYITYTSTWYESGTESSVATVTTTQDGSAGEWSYDDKTDSSNNDSGSW